MSNQKKSTHTKQTSSRSKKGSMAKTIAKAGVGVAAAAGVIAAGVALADKDTRQKIGHTAKKAMRGLEDAAGTVASSAQNGYERMQDQVGAVGGESIKKKQAPAKSGSAKS